MKTLIVTFITSLFVLSIFSPAWSGRGDMDLKFKGETLSASLNGVTLKAVFDKLREEKDIWFQLEDSLLENVVSIQFKDLSFQDGLKRIISRMNYSLIFDRNGKLNGVIIIGKGKSVQAVSKGNEVSTNRSITTQIGKKNVEDIGPFKVIRNIPTPGDSSKSASKDFRGFQVIKSHTPPGGEIEITTKELQNLKVIRNCPPPGGPVEVTAEKVEEFKVIKNCPPPGGPVNASADELEGLKG